MNSVAGDSAGTPSADSDASATAPGASAQNSVPDQSAQQPEQSAHSLHPFVQSAVDPADDDATASATSSSSSSDSHRSSVTGERAVQSTAATADRPMSATSATATASIEERPHTRLRSGIRKPKIYTNGTVKWGLLTTTGEPQNLHDALCDKH